jgi:hypothetical protein
MTFTGDMAAMQVFYGLYGYGATHAVQFLDVAAEGCLGDVYIGGCDTGALDQVLDDGRTMSDHIADCAASARTHGQFVSCVSRLATAWMKAGLITEEQREALMECAGQAGIP